MKIKIIEDIVVARRIERNFTINIKNGVDLKFAKWIVEDEIENDADWEFDKDSQIIFDKLSEEEQENIEDFLLDLKV